MMYNTNMPSRAELPSSGQLLRSTILALIAAIVILVTIVLPSEYGIDPTGIGQKLGLVEMGNIKTQLAAEAQADAQAKQQVATVATPAASGKVTAPAPTPAPAPAANSTAEAPAGKSDEVSFVLKPGQGAEIKLVMKAGAKANYSWTANGAVVNFDTHGDGGGRSIMYEKGRGVPSDEGVLEAAFDGNHGWFWRNRTNSDVTVTLKTNGDYIELKRVV
jgi:hypothetical protein